MTAVVAMMTMVGLGFDFNLGELVAACSPGNIAIAFCVVIGAIIGSGLAGKLVGFILSTPLLQQVFAWQTEAEQEISQF